MSSQPNRSHLAGGLRLGLCLGLALGIAATLPAATYTWDGDGPGGNWSTAGNWTASPGGAPSITGGHDLKFAGSLNTNTTVSGGTWTVGSLTFESSATSFTSGGNGLRIGGGATTTVINNSTHTQTINNQIDLISTQTWNAASGAIVTGSSQVDGNNHDFTVTGSSAVTFGGQVGRVGTLTLSGSGNRTFSGPIASTTMVNVASSGINTFSGQINASVNASAGTSTFANVQAGSSGITVSGTANATFTGPVTGGSGGINISSSGNVNFSGTINSGALTLNGTGTTTLSGTGSKSTGAVVVNNGTLILAQTGGGDAIGNSLTINNGGSVIMQGDDQVPAWQTVTLNQGSSLYLGNTEQTFKDLTINGDSVIDFGGGGSQLNVSGNITIANNVTITIVNWDSVAGDVFAGKNPGAPIVNVQYADNNGNIYATGTWGGGTITPGTPVPEPVATGFFILGAGLGLVALRRPRR